MLAEFALKQCKLDLSGASTTDIAVRSTAPFTAKISGASTFRGKVEAPELDLEADGASRAILNGTAKKPRSSLTVRVISSSMLSKSKR